MRILQPQTESGPRNIQELCVFRFVFIFSCFISFSNHVKSSCSFLYSPIMRKCQLFSFVYRVSFMCN